MQIVAFRGNQGGYRDPILGSPLNSWLANGDYRRAADWLATHGHDFETRDALGVCLMRLGRATEAMHLYRNFALQRGATWTRPDISDRIRRNFATSLLLCGLPSGAAEILDETKDRLPPRYAELRTAIKRWAASLPWWRRLVWRIGNLEPGRTSVTLPFLAGELASDVGLDPAGKDRLAAA